MTSDEQTRANQTAMYLERHRAGDPQALNELFQRSLPKVERIVRVRLWSSLRRKVQVADIVQEALLIAFKKLDDFEPREDAHFVDWLARLAENRIRDEHRHWGRAARDPGREVPLGPSPVTSAAAWDPPDPATSITGRIQKAEASDLVDECIAQLSPDHREVLLLRNHSGASFEYIAEVMHRSTPAAASQLHRRAMEELQRRVKGKIGTHGSA